MFDTVKAIGARIRSPRRGIGAAVVLAGALGLSATALQAAPSADAASAFHYQRGYSVQGSWLCYGFSDGALHCTQHWHRSGGRLVSDNTAWVPNTTATSTVSSTKTTTTAKKATTTTTTTTKKATTTAKKVSYPTGPNRYPWGQCTWYARSRGGEKLNGLGNAMYWLSGARARGLATGTTPRVGATVVLQPHVQGAGSLGHVGHVEKVYSNGTFLISDSNWIGLGKISYHTLHTGAGVGFIY